MGLWYMKDSGFELTGFSDADYAGCKDTFKSTSGGTQFLGKKLVGWSLKKQDCMVLSIAKVEYVSLSACCAQVIWMRTQLTNYGLHFNKIPIYCDSKSTIAISISSNPVQHSRTKHIDVCYHFIKEHMEKGIRRRYNFIPAELRFTTSCSIDKDKYMMKAQVHVSKSSAISDVQALPHKEHYRQDCWALTKIYLTSGSSTTPSIMWYK
nr:retrovirus-related Pol polyprotein from transposon TNT 1-94 [Tanacetum cinerariifolium]